MQCQQPLTGESKKVAEFGPSSMERESTNISAIGVRRVTQEKSNELKLTTQQKTEIS